VRDPELFHFLNNCEDPFYIFPALAPPARAGVSFGMPTMQSPLAKQF
jgi:hypothetical protein